MYGDTIPDAAIGCLRFLAAPETSISNSEAAESRRSTHRF
jgi:hypothetical protein